MTNRSEAAKKAWLSRQHSAATSSASELEQQMRAQRMAVLKKRVKGSDSMRARALAADMRKSFKAFGIKAMPWFKGLKALAHGRGMKDYDMERRVGLPKENTWRPIRRMSDSVMNRIHRLEAKMRRR